MANRRLLTVAMGLVVAMASSTGMGSAVTRAADRLVADQITAGDWTDGSWPGEPAFAGESTVGLARAYEWTNDIAYKTAAERGGAYSLAAVGYDAATHSFSGEYTLYPAEAYAMARLSSIQANPDDNYWRTALVDNLNVANAGVLVDWYQDNANAEDSSAVYDVARMAVAANYADHASKTIWRDGVIALLTDVDDGAASPVMALGAAVWALASTGDISGDTRPVWADADWEVQVKDLPVALAGLQAPDHTFYTTFDPELGYGFTETTAMGTLGLMAADASSDSYSYTSEIALASNVLKAGVGDPDGDLYWLINDTTSGSHYFIAGETLEVVKPQDYSYPVFVAEFGMTGQIGTLAADYNLDGRVDLDDFAILRSHWDESVPAAPKVDETTSTPEPTTLILMGAGGLAVIRRRRRPTERRIARQTAR